MSGLTVKPRCRGEALLCRYADDSVCTFRYQDDADRFYRVLPQRLKKFGLEIAPEKTRCLHFSRFHARMKQRFTFLGFEIYWLEDRTGVPRVKRRTARKKLRAACRRIKDWEKENRHAPVRELFRGLNRRLRGHYNSYGAQGNWRSLDRLFRWAVAGSFKWLNRRGGKRRSYNWPAFDNCSTGWRLPGPGS